MKKVFIFATSILNRFPLASFLISLTILIGLIAIGQYLPSNKADKTPKPAQPRQITTLDLSQPQFYTTTGTTDIKSQANITASTAGFITKINFHEGKTIQKGQTLAIIGSDIYGNNPAIYQSQLAQTNLNFQTQTATLSAEITKLQRDLAELGDTVSDKNNQINKDSRERTQDLISQTESILNKVNTQLSQAYNDPLLSDQISTLEQTKLTLSASLSQLRSALSAADLQSPDNTPAQISDRSRDLSYKQLELKQQSETLTRDIANINLKLARLSESAYRPVSPITGKIQQILVKPGQTVAPGTLLAVVASNTSDVKITSYISANLVNYIDTTQPATVQLNDHQTSAKILFISQIPTLNQLHAVTLSLPQTAITTDFTSTPEVKLPLTSKVLFIPIDSIYQTATSTYVYKVAPSDQGPISQRQDIKTATVLGSLIQVTDGLSHSDILITSRFTTPNQLITTN